jgi:hypothetical protein
LIYRPLERGFGHQQPRREVIGFQLVGIEGDEARARYMHATLGQDVIHVARQEIVPEFVADAETLEARAGNMRRLYDAETVAMPQQHPRHSLGLFRLALDHDVAAFGDREWVDGEARYAFFLEKRLGRLSGHLQAEDVAQGS